MIITEINSDFPKELLDRIDKLLSTISGTIPGDRAFGIDQSIQDMPVAFAKTKYVAEITQKVKKYVPELKVVSVMFETNEDSKLIPKVVIDWN